MQPFDYPIEVPLDELDSVDGSIMAEPWEELEPGKAETAYVIRTDQKWGATVTWEVHGSWIRHFDDDFHLKLYVESIGEGPETAFPPQPVVVNGLDFPVLPRDEWIEGKPTRRYEKRIEVAAGELTPGAYKMVVLLEVFHEKTTTPLPYAGMVELPVIHFFTPE